ncbi:unnamed protein product [Orchesella dallaii]|uniref:Ionotropic glutamate receptor C-terminal domain-containing protein n=1 Tax=Orchesella dallaii TaxID=48710 RepID=A0ABP1Q7B5_9HEXA
MISSDQSIDILVSRHKFLQNSTHSKRSAKPIQQQAYEHILEENAQVISHQRYSSSRHLLLIWDSTFPKSNWESRALQTVLAWEQHKPFKIPTVMLLATTYHLMETYDGAVNSIFTKALLIFIIMDDNDKSSVRIGCFACGESVMSLPHYITGETEVYEIVFQNVSNESMSSLKHLMLFWENLHSNLYFGSQDPISTNTNPLYAVYSKKTCKLYETYCLHKNFTDNGPCVSYHINGVRLFQQTPLEIPHFGQKIFSYGQKEIDFTFQVIIPKRRVLEGQLGAFLIPFQGTVWLCTLFIMAIISIWLIWVEKQCVDEVFIWQLSIPLEQDGGEFSGIRIQGKVITMTWIFCAILIRQFYNSSLYSFMTAEPKPTDLPQTMDEVFYRMDFDILIPSSFIRDLYTIFQMDEDSTLSPQLTKLYLKIIHKSYFMKGWLHIPTLLNASNAKFAEIWQFPSPRIPFNTSKEIAEFAFSNRKNGKRKFSKFCVMCEENCEDKWNTAFFGQIKLHRIVPKQRPFFRTTQFWILNHPNFATGGLSDFLGRIVQSGIHEFDMNNFTMLEHVQLLQSLNKFRQLGYSNGSLFSYVFLAEKKEMHSAEKEISATNISALTGTFIIAAIMMGIAIIALLVELFVWEEEINVTKSLFDSCIIYHCILIQFHSLQLEYKFLQNSIHSKRRAKPIQQQAYEHILEENARVISHQRYSSFHHLLLIWDSTFPKSNWESRALYTIISLEHHKLFTIPTVMLLATTSKLMETATDESAVNSIFTNALLIFINLDDNSVRIGCFACKHKVQTQRHHKNNTVHVYITVFKNIEKDSIVSMKSLMLLREQLHSNFYFGPDSSSLLCHFNNLRKCKLYKTFCLHKNYTDNLKCVDYYIGVVRFALEVPNFGQQIFSYGQNEIDFTFQVIIPKMKVLEGNLDAFLIPFEATIWYCTLLTIAIISIWLIWVEKQRVDKVLIWQFSIPLEQDGGELKQSRFDGKVITMTWIFCAILLRQFYNSSLYSFMTAEPEPNDLPQTVDEVLSRMDFDLLIPSLLIPELFNIFLKDEDSTLAPRLTKFYLKIIHNSYFIKGWLHIPTLRNVSTGKYAEVWHFPSNVTPYNNSKEIAEFAFSNRKNGKQKCSKFCVLCEENCED